MTDEEKRKLIREYSNLLKSEDEAGKAAFRERNRDNTFIMSLINLQEAFVSTLKKFYDQLMSAREEEDPKIRRALLESAGESIIEATLEEFEDDRG